MPCYDVFILTINQPYNITQFYCCKYNLEQSILSLTDSIFYIVRYILTF